MNRAYDFPPKSLSVIFFSFESDVVNSCVMIDIQGLMFLIEVVVVILFHLKLLK